MVLFFLFFRPSLGILLFLYILFDVVLFSCSVALSPLFFSSFYPIHPVSFTLIFSPLLNFLFKPNLSGRGLVKMVRNSTYKPGYKEWGTNCHTCCHTCIRLTLLYCFYPFQQLNSISNLPHLFYLPHHLGVVDLFFFLKSGCEIPLFSCLSEGHISLTSCRSLSHLPIRSTPSSVVNWLICSVVERLCG